VNACARVVAAGDDRGGTRLISLRSAAPLLVRPTSRGVYLVGGAAGPIGGDRLRLEIDLGTAARLTVRTAASSVALPGQSGEASTLHVEAAVGDGGSLRWLPEPAVAAACCHHRSTARVSVGTGGRLLWREELILGRHGEQPGAFTSRLSIDVAGAPLLRQELSVGPGHPGWDGPAVAGSSRAVGSVVVVDPRWVDSPPPRPTAPLGEQAAVLALSGPAVQVVALADDAVALRRLLDAGVDSFLDENGR